LREGKGPHFIIDVRRRALSYWHQPGEFLLEGRGEVDKDFLGIEGRNWRIESGIIIDHQHVVFLLHEVDELPRDIRMRALLVEYQIPTSKRGGDSGGLPGWGRDR